MHINYPRGIVLKLLAPIVTLLFLLVLTVSPALAKAGNIKEFTVPTPQSSPEGVVPGPDGNLWFTENNGNNIGRLTPSGKFTEFPIPTKNSIPIGITLGPDGNLWFDEFKGNKIGRITPSGQITEFRIPTPDSRPDFIITGPDGNLWFDEFKGNKIGRIYFWSDHRISHSQPKELPRLPRAR